MITETKAYSDIYLAYAEIVHHEEEGWAVHQIVHINKEVTFVVFKRRRSRRFVDQEEEDM